MTGEPTAPSDHPSPRAIAHRRYVDASVILAVITVVGVALALWRRELDGSFTVAVGVLGVLTGFVLVWFVGVMPMLAVRHYRYELTPHAVYTQRGVFSRHHAVVPYARVQTVKTTAGPIERRMGLTTLVVITAADAHPIRMLDAELADELRERIGRLARETHDDL